jgi:IclR family pca regulon transcriptional regulator
MGGLAKGLAVLEAFGPTAPQLTLAEAARLSGITRAAARRCLLTLTELGYVEFDGKYFMPRPRLTRLGSRYLDTISLPQIAQPILMAARDLLSESISLAILDGEECLFVARAEARWIVSTGVRLGGRLPAYCSATGRVLLSGMSDRAVRDYLAKIKPIRRTPKTLVTRSEIMRAITTARAEGVALCDEELEIGLRAMALPVRDGDGRIVASLSLSAASARIGADQMKAQYTGVLRQFAETLSRSL